MTPTLQCGGEEFGMKIGQNGLGDRGNFFEKGKMVRASLCSEL
jgi:hypothetical protein